MLKSFIYPSNNNNLYIYDDQSKLCLLVHPEFDKACQKSTNVDPYYLKKYIYFKKHGFFGKSKPVDFIRLEESMIVDNIKNTQQIVFETTDSCNLNCTYCALGDLYEGYDDRVGKKINIHHAIHFLKYIFNLRPKSKNKTLYLSFYGGEPLLNINFIKRIVEVSKQLNTEKGIDLIYGITTNATLLHKYIDFLAANKFVVLISLDGNEENQSYRIFSKNKKNSFQQVIENIDIIQRNYPEYFSTHIFFNAVLHDRNSVKDILEFIYMRYNKIARVSELNMRDMKSEYERILKKMFHSKRESEAEFQKEESDLLHLTHNQLSSFNDLTNFLKFCSINYYISNINALLFKQERYLQTGTCTPFSKKIFLTNQSKLLPCEKISYQYSMGEVNENITINTHEIARQYNFYYERLRKFCQTCYAYRFCGTCLFHLKNIENMDDEDFICDSYCNQEDYKSYLSHIFSFLEKYPNDFSQILEDLIIE